VCDREFLTSFREFEDIEDGNRKRLNGHLVYRTDDQLREFAAGIDPRRIDGIEIVREPEGINSFLVLRRRRETSSAR
jgi:hypothetical protein